MLRTLTLSLTLAACTLGGDPPDHAAVQEFCRNPDAFGVVAAPEYGSNRHYCFAHVAGEPLWTLGAYTDTDGEFAPGTCQAIDPAQRGGAVPRDQVTAWAWAACEPWLTDPDTCTEFTADEWWYDEDGGGWRCR